MAKSHKSVVQNYERDDSGFIDVSKLLPHKKSLKKNTLAKLIKNAIQEANKKSSRQSLNIPEEANPAELQKIYKQAGKKLFAYFKKYCGDPASTAHQVLGKHYLDVAREQFRNRTLQKERMNSGWRYQFLAFSCASASGRFSSVADIGSAEADFNAVIEYKSKANPPLSLYVSVKNRVNTMGGQDWPKAIQALERVASGDKNRRGPYCCIFGIAMEHGTRQIKRNSKTHQPHSGNTEVWLSDFFWPFFANLSYKEIMESVLTVLLELESPPELVTQLEIPDEVLKVFGECCEAKELLDTNGKFANPYRLVEFFCE